MMGVSDVFFIGFFVFASLPCAFATSVFFCPQPFLPRIQCALQERRWKAQLGLFTSIDQRNHCGTFALVDEKTVSDMRCPHHTTRGQH